MREKICCDIVIIDSGIVPSEKADYNGIHLYMGEDGGIQVDDNIWDNVGHGTAIYNIIRSHNKNIDVFFIRLFDMLNLSIDESLLIFALDYIYNNITCKLINVSLGVNISTQYNEMNSICQKLNRRGSLVISAFDNLEAISYPAAFDEVIGVISGADCIKITDIETTNHPVVNVCAKGGLQRIHWTEPKFIFTQGNSYACAHVTGLLSHFIHTGAEISLNSAMKYLSDMARKKHSFRVSKSCDTPPPLEKYDKAAIFPFNKEMHSLMRFRQLLHVNITDVYDVKYSARVNASINSLLNINGGQDFIIKNIEHIDWNSFDTLILGHTDELIYLLHDSHFVEKLILQAYNKGKNIYSFDDLSEYIKAHHLNPERIYYPRACLSDVSPIPFGLLYRPWVPMLGIFGTTSKQGKFSLQLTLREKFLRDNYRLGQIGSEPSSWLFGMDSCFHFGYRSKTDIVRQNTVSYMNAIVNDISRKEVDIIVSGCQSGTVTYDFGNVRNYTFSQTEFLLSTLPDAVILCVNPFDETKYIERTIQYIESCADCDVIALVIFPMEYDVEKHSESTLSPLSADRQILIKNEFLRLYKRSTYILGNADDMETLYLQVIQYFS